MSYHPVESIDYIDDYFSFLDLGGESMLLAMSIEGPSDPKNEEFVSLVKASYHRLAASYHPDKVANAGQELQAIAVRRFHLIKIARDTLSDFEKRSNYIQKFLTFDENLRSKEGNPILNFSKERIDIDFLLSGNEAGIDSKLDSHAKVLSGYNEAVFDIIKSQYESNSNPSKDLRDAYLSQLIGKNAYFGAKEGFAWEKAGVVNKQVCDKIEDTELYLEIVRSEIQKTKDEIISTSKLIVQQIANKSGRKLLLSSAEILPDSMDSLSLEQLKRLLVL